MYSIIDYLDSAKKIIENERINKSPYVAALQHSRFATNRDEKTGEKKNNRKHGSWLGTVGYMIVLDHIGNKFNICKSESRIIEIAKKLNKSVEKVPSLIRAPGYFSDLSNDKIFALYALRCSLVHDFFLYNNKDKNYMHHFSVTEGDGEIVTLPNIKWDGNLKNRNINVTVVNLEAFSDLVEEIHEKLLEFAKKGMLKINTGITLEYLTYF